MPLGVYWQLKVSLVVLWQMRGRDRNSRSHCHCRESPHKRHPETSAEYVSYPMAFGVSISSRPAKTQSRGLLLQGFDTAAVVRGMSFVSDQSLTPLSDSWRRVSNGQKPGAWDGILVGANRLIDIRAPACLPVWIRCPAPETSVLALGQSTARSHSPAALSVVACS